jgi:hypothetical protein
MNTQNIVRLTLPAEVGIPNWLPDYKPVTIPTPPIMIELPPFWRHEERIPLSCPGPTFPGYAIGITPNYRLNYV